MLKNTTDQMILCAKISPAPTLSNILKYIGKNPHMKNVKIPIISPPNLLFFSIKFDLFKNLGADFSQIF